MIDSGFHFVAARETIYSSSIPGDDERTYSNQMISRLENHPMTSSNGVIVLPLPPVGGGRGQKENDQFKWARRKWIRTAVEEIGHAAQMLGTWMSPDHDKLSMKLANERLNLTSEISRQGRILNEKARDSALAGHGLWTSTNWVYEADIYAFMIENLGPEFVPPWVGSDSGYSLRELIDQQFTIQGMTGRQWPK